MNKSIKTSMDSAAKSVSSKNALNERETRLWEVLENSLDASYKRNLKTGTYEYMSPAFYRISGYTPEEMKTVSMVTVMGRVHPDDRPAILNMLASSSMTSSDAAVDLEYRFKHKDGGYRWFQDRFIVLKDDAGIPVAHIGSVRDITRNKQLEVALQASEAKYRFLIENSYDIVYQLTKEGIFSFVSPAWTRLLGHLPEHVIGQSFTRFVHPDDVPACMEFLQTVIETGQRQTGIEYRVRHSDGSWFWHASSAVPFRDDSSIVTGFTGISRDITATKNADAALKESETNFRSFFECMTDMIVVATDAGELLYTNTAAMKMLGFTKDEFQGMNILDLHPLDRREGCDEIVSDMLKGHRSICPLPLERKDGTIVPVETRVLRGQWSGVECLFGISKDLSSEQEAQQRFERIFRNSPALMALSTLPERQFFDVNDAFLKTLGYTRDEIIGYTARELGLFPDMDTHDSSGGNLLKSGHVADVELHVQHKDGSILHGLFSGDVILSQGKRYFLTVMIDITKRKQAEKALSESRAELELFNKNLETTVAERTAQLEASNTELESFAYSISHDLRAPLRAMEGFSDLLLQTRRDSLDSQSVHYMERIQTASRRMGELINDLLSLSQVTRYGFGFATVDLSLLASRIFLRLGLIHPTNRVQTNVMPGLTASGDEKLLGILFEHLIDNAWKFSKNRNPAVISVGRQTHNGEEVFFVRDNGIGFDMAFQEQLFKPFHKLNGIEATEGTGIGLVTALKIVERHGGRIWVESRPDAGATFYFTLAPRETPTKILEVPRVVKFKLTV